MHPFRSLFLFTVALLALTAGALPPQAQEQPRYEVVDLGTLGGERSQANAVNSWGLVVGWAETGARDEEGEPIYHAFIWDPELGMRDLGTLGGRWSEAHDLNDGGQAVGWSNVDPSLGPKLDSQPFVWERRAGMRSLPSGARPSWEEGRGAAHGINNNGLIVGMLNVGFDDEASLWRDGRRERLFHVDDGAAYAVNARGTAVGWDWTGDYDGATRWKGLDYWDKKVFLFYSSIAYEIDDADRIVGSSFRGPFLWERGRVRLLGHLPGRPGGAGYGIRANTVVGSCWNHPEHPGYPNSDQEIRQPPTGARAFLWHRGRMRDLNDLIPRDSGWELEAAKGINKRGQIAGYGLHNGIRRAFLLQPTGGQ